ncbi:TetR/AcrR family transcriptional regulator [soil metagenome]
MEKNRQARAEATRRQLVDAAREVFAERGYGGATVAVITERADTAHGTFYLYFKNKEAIFLHVISDVLEDLYQHSFTPIEDLPGHFDASRSRERIAGFVAVFSRHGGIWRALLEGALASKVVQEHWMTERRRFIDAVAYRWEVFQEGGTLQPFDTQMAATALSAMLEWVAFTSVVFGQYPGQEDGDAADGQGLSDPKVAEALTDLWVRALGMGR